jgi:hypothetical protein
MPIVGARRSSRERLQRASLLQVLYTVHSKRLLIEQLDYNFLVLLFVRNPMCDVTTFIKHRERLLVGKVAKGFSTL